MLHDSESRTVTLHVGLAIVGDMTTQSGFSATSTTEDVLSGIDLSGKRYLVTGSSGGLGLETTRALAAHGATVVMAARDETKNAAAADSIRQEHSDADLESLTIDLGSLASVRRAAATFMADSRPLHGLIANAGVMATPYGTTVDGFETQFGVDHLGHFLFVRELLPKLVQSAPARVVLLSSAGHRLGDIDLNDVNFQNRPYDPLLSYGAAKTANILHAVEIDRRYRDKGVRAFAVHPGGIHTELGRYMTMDVITSLMDRIGEQGASFSWKTVPQGAATTTWAATSALLNDMGGVYCEDCNVSPVLQGDDEGINGVGVAARAVDATTASALWDLSDKLVAL